MPGMRLVNCLCTASKALMSLMSDQRFFTVAHLAIATADVVVFGQFLHSSMFEGPRHGFPMYLDCNVPRRYDTIR